MQDFLEEYSRLRTGAFVGTFWVAVHLQKEGGDFRHNVWFLSCKGFQAPIHQPEGGVNSSSCEVQGFFLATWVFLVQGERLLVVKKGDVLWVSGVFSSRAFTYCNVNLNILGLQWITLHRPQNSYLGYLFKASPRTRVFPFDDCRGLVSRSVDDVRNLMRLWNKIPPCCYTNCKRDE